MTFMSLPFIHVIAIHLDLELTSTTLAFRSVGVAENYDRCSASIEDKDPIGSDIIMRHLSVVFGPGDLNGGEARAADLFRFLDCQASS
jgi:hypothetical protein